MSLIVEKVRHLSCTFIRLPLLRHQHIWTKLKKLWFWFETKKLFITSTFHKSDGIKMILRSILCKCFVSEYVFWRLFFEHNRSINQRSLLNKNAFDRTESFFEPVHFVPILTLVRRVDIPYYIEISSNLTLFWYKKKILKSFWKMWYDSFVESKKKNHFDTICVNKYSK